MIPRQATVAPLLQYRDTRSPLLKSNDPLSPANQIATTFISLNNSRNSKTPIKETLLHSFKASIIFTEFVQSDTETLNLLSYTSIQKYIQNKYRFIHFGLVLVAVKPLVHKGIDCPIYMALRDNRLKTYKDSLLAVVQTNVCNGPVYFNCFPDYTVDLSDPLIQESLILDLHVSGNKFKEFANNFAIVFRIYFRLMSSTVNPKFIHEPSFKEETIFIEVHAKDTKTRSLVTTAKALPWDKITIPEVLMIPKEPPTRNMIKQDLDKIKEDDKRVLLRFGSFRESTLTHSTPSSSFIPPRRSRSQLNSSNNRYRVYNKTLVPEYEATSSPPQSPTASDFQSVNTITGEFKINKEYLRNDFNSSQNSVKRKSFLSFEKETKDEIRDAWYKDMRKLSVNVPFFIWFDLYCQRLDIINPYCFSSIHVQSKLAQNWNLTDGRTVTSVHPPPKSFKFSQVDKEVEAAPYKTGRTHQASDPVVVDDIIKVYQQNNYSNQILQTIALQVDHVSTKLDAVKTQANESSKSVIQKPLSRFPNTESQPHFKPQNLPYSVTTKVAEDSGSSSSSSADLLQKIPSSLSLLASKHVNVISKPLGSESDSIESSSDSDDEISQIKERSKFKTNQYSPNTIHEWNIDGKSEYEILNTLQEMGMATAAYKIQESREQVVFSMLIAGFTGQLKNWWDNSLTVDNQLEILNHKIVRYTEGDMEVEVNDCCDYLLIVIGMYFIGNPKEEFSSQKIVLTNLRCPTLSDYRWYKDMFLTYVLRRPDCNEGFWMEKFVSGLPKLFSQRIFRNLKETMGSEIIACKSKYQSSPPKYYQKRRLKRYPKKQSQNKEIICFKCGKPGHKADKCFTKNKINELFQDNPEMCQKLSKLFLKSSSSEEESNDEINIIQESSDDESYDSASSSPILMVNVISDKDDKTFLFDLIDKVDDPDIKRDALLRLKSLVIQEQTLSTTVPPNEPFSISKLFNNYPANTIKGKSLKLSSSPLKQLQQELYSLKAQVNDLHNQLQNIHINESELDLRLSALEHKNAAYSTPNEPDNSKNKGVIEEIIAENVVIEDQFVQTIQKVNFQKWYAIVTLKVKDFSKNFLALIDSGADQNCIKYGIVPHRANSHPLNVKYKLPKASIVNDGYCFHNTFIVKTLPCLVLPHPDAFTIVETDASDIGYGGVLKQKLHDEEQLVRFHSGSSLKEIKIHFPIFGQENFCRAEMWKNKGKAPKIQTGQYQSSDDYEMEIQISKPSCSNPRVDIQIPKPPTTPIKTSNTFNPLSSQPCRPALPYNQALQNQPTTQKEKDAYLQNTSLTQGYFTKSTTEPTSHPYQLVRAFYQEIPIPKHSKSTDGPDGQSRLIR
ncbi:hypothetical protein RND81_13G081900 [Saponaria officinalis]|uniref:CCHC-type domain-containing protein n=1 Tax=Saponaria officinalis TaxID=3572 RepID=A0AAW1H1M5_SAPOF